ncbi:pectinesterase/pectinesterase inhibitor PPE8B-like [Benincasa hispida]|uniref:pectinesterase/pectinesterase inhibitor PPE8B-like n=1 Tax=Benincasa hispida TaxID=102211 RepID=UPI0019010D90|nr:pectinesterase/pectinesterase inhibitor PPE8B-like [Benincasa hispida]
MAKLTTKPLQFCCFFFILLFPILPATSSVDLVQTECLKVPFSQFSNSLLSTIDGVRQVMTIFSPFTKLLGDLRLSTAISDCLDLLDSSVDQLSWSLSATQNPKAKDYSTGDLSSDLKTWLSAAVVNPETCIDGFEGTNSFIKGLVSGGIDQLTSQLYDLLSMVKSFPNNQPAEFPSWVKSEDRNLLHLNDLAADATVAADGTGDFTSVMDAVRAAPDNSIQRYVIYIKRGVYLENVEIKKKKWNLMMIGDGIDATIISGKRNFVDGWTTFRSATFAVSGRGFIARDITFENTAGPEKHQAVALRSDSDLSVFFRCRIRGYQDTLYTHTMRQFYRECQISGTVDFLFGDGTVVFQNCTILAKKGLPNQKNTITAQGRKDPNQPTGFSIQFCNISADSDLEPLVNTTATYLGRPWKEYSRTIIMQSYMSDAIRPEGWLEWNGDFALNTLFYAEFMNHGPGARLAKRVNWPGYRRLNHTSEATNFTVAQFIEGNMWLPSTGVKFTAGLGAN